MSMLNKYKINPTDILKTIQPYWYPYFSVHVLINITSFFLCVCFLRMQTEYLFKMFHPISIRNTHRHKLSL